VVTFVPNRRNPAPIFVQFGHLTVDEAALDRIVREERALILVDPARRDVVARLATRLAYRDRVRTSARVVLAPR
jgi:hypothetical protein